MVKRILIMMSLVASLAALAGCPKPEEPTPTPAPPRTDAPPPVVAPQQMSPGGPSKSPK